MIKTITDEITGMKSYFFKDNLTGNVFKVLATEEEVQLIFRANPDLEPVEISDDMLDEFTSIHLDTFE